MGKIGRRKLKKQQKEMEAVQRFIENAKDPNYKTISYYCLSCYMPVPDEIAELRRGGRCPSCGDEYVSKFPNGPIRVKARHGSVMVQHRS